MAEMQRHQGFHDDASHSADKYFLLLKKKIKSIAHISLIRNGLNRKKISQKFFLANRCF
jgi:hypothetical protein